MTTMTAPPPSATPASTRVRQARARFLDEIRSVEFSEGVAIVCDFLGGEEPDLDGILTWRLLTALHGFGRASLEPFYLEAGLVRDPSERRVHELRDREKERIAAALRRRCG